MSTQSVKDWFILSQAILSMLLVQIFSAGMQVLSRVILVEGAFIFALLTYRSLIAAICILPFALYFEREWANKLNWKVWCWLFANALVGMTLAIALFYYGLRDTSATYSINLLNLIPIFTFVTSIILRMEKLRIGTWGGKAKSIGAIICVGGALVTGLYKGKQFYIGHHSHPLTHTTVVASHKTHMLRGTLFLVGSCCSYTAWYIMQVKLVKVFPLRLWGSMLSFFMAAIQSIIIGLSVNRNPTAWKLEWNLQLITILYSGILGSAAVFCLVSWAITIKGPTYPPMFNPLAVVFVAIAEAIILGEPLSVGMLLGMILIIAGLYSYLWGKKNETNVAAAAESSTTIVDQPTLPQTTGVIVPISSPNEVVLEIDKQSKTEETHQQSSAGSQ